MNPGGSDGVSESSAAAAAAAAAAVKRKKPKYSRFTQQELPACKPILTPGWVITAFVLVAIIFIPIGLASLFASEHVVEIVDRYDKSCIPSNYSNNVLAYIQSAQTNKTCTRSLTVPKQMKSPIYIYYQLDNFYQNHRRYVKSRSDNQLRSRAYEFDVEDCEPEAKTDKGPIVPCGLIAWSLFNDTYGFMLQNKSLQVSKKDIAWKSDQRHKFGSDVYPKNFQSGGLIGGAKLNESIPLSNQVDLIVWMRTAALPTFRKLYGKIEVDLEANQNITVVIQNNYNTYSFGGKKKLVLSTTSWIGGKNDFLGIAYLTVGGLCLFLAMSFIVLYVVKPRPLGDPSYLSWNRNPAGHLN
ncbi:ALA-interacting subunit 1-like isoform X2 [Camellia sinensis]|uniref:ALA-interacting subunit 1-like isoform X2 n=1 Tax=Camellia sinensis TaxID=4442 RepID=UPI0010355F11|nr:ALA-interacting subunit 1-like isoform X2 [Camellia sinensis]